MDRNVYLLRAIQVTALILAIKILFAKLLLEEETKGASKYPSPDKNLQPQKPQPQKPQPQKPQKPQNLPYETAAQVKKPSDAIDMILEPVKPQKSDLQIRTENAETLRFENYTERSYQYSSHYGIGTPMQIVQTPAILSDIKGLESAKTIKLPDRKFPTLVGAISANHLNEMKDHLPSYIKFLTSPELKEYFDPITEIYIWNIDSDINFSKTIEETMQPLFEEHGITIKVPFFNNTDYPEHVANLHSYAWKVLINTKMLAEFGTLWWFDASIIPRKERFEDFAKTVYEQIYEDNECFIFTAPSSLHGQGWGTCHTMLDYLPTDEKIWYDTPKERPNSRKVDLPTEVGRKGFGWLLVKVPRVLGGNWKDFNKILM